MAGGRIGKKKYILLRLINDNVYKSEYPSFREATAAYRRARRIYGDNVVLTQVIIDYGEEV